MRALAIRSVEAALYVAAFTVVASLIFLYAAPAGDGTRLAAHVSYPFYQWWFYAVCCYDKPIVNSWLLLSGAPAVIIQFLLFMTVAYKRRYVRGWSLRRDWPATRFPSRPVRGRTDNNGHARWATEAEMRGQWPDDTTIGGVVVGECADPRVDKGPFSPLNPATWGRGGKAPLLIDPCREGSTHSMIVAGSGSYKTVSAVSTGLTWRGSMVALDPSAELGPMLAQERRRMGHRVFILTPETATTVGFNVLEWIDITSPIAETDIAAVVEWVAGYTPKSDKTNEFFKNRGKALITCLLAHLVWDSTLPADQKTLRTLRGMLAVPGSSLQIMLKNIWQHSESRLARDLAAHLSKLADDAAETFGGIHDNADEDTKWLSIKAYAELVSGNTFKATDVINGRTDVFVSLPLKVLQATPGVARCIIGALLNSVYEANGNITGRVLFLLDEAARLGRMDIIELARDAGRKYGITLHLLYQSVGQIEQQWGREGKRAWDESLSWRAYAAVNDIATAKELSETIGEFGVISWSESQQRRMRWVMPRNSLTYTERPRRLIRPEEIMELRADAQIIISQGIPPAITGRAIYFRRPEFSSRVDRNRFAKGVTNA
jgi:type IV secretion system protein VirD4